MAQAYVDNLDSIYRETRHPHDVRKQEAAGKLPEQAASALRELAPNDFNRYYRELLQRMTSAITNGQDSNERVGGLYALMAMIDFKGDDAPTKVTRFSTLIKRTLEGNDTTAMLVAAKCLGKLTAPGGALSADLVEAEVKQALEWLTSGQQENKRFASTLVLRELARSNPTLLYMFIPGILINIWEGLRDQKVLIRETAAETVSQCFKVLSARDPQTRSTCLNRFFEEAQSGFRRGTVEFVHASLLAYKELLVQGGMFMHGNRYKDACERVLQQQYRDHRDITIRRTVVEILPIVAGYAPKEFCHHYLARSMQHLQALLRDPKQRNVAFTAIGQIAHAVGSQIAPYLDTILLHIREALSAKYRTKAGDAEPIFNCISMISIAVGQTLSKYMEALLDPIFACGLSEALTQALVDMAHYIPPVKPTIQEKLLDLLSKVLCGQPFQQLGHPSHGKAPPPVFTTPYRDQKDPQIPSEEKAHEIALALETLGSFDFSGHILNEFVKDVAIRYVEDDVPRIRRAAALTSCQLFIRDPIVHQTSYHSIQVVGEIVERLLTVGVADPDAEIRHTVLESLDARFDKHLAKAENVRTLFLTLNDERFSIREAAITIIGRLTAVNPAYVFPSLRKVLVQLLTEIEYSNNATSRRESAQLISHLVNASSKLIKSYVDPMVTVLLPKADESHADVAATALRAIGSLATVGGDEMHKYIPALMTIIIRSLQDIGSPNKREAALSALGQLASNSGYVIQPYLDHPELLTILVNIVKNEHPGPLRRETIRLMGILGALDPYKHQQVIEESPEANLKAEAEMESDVTLIMRGITPSMEEYYPTIVINTLLQMLKDDTLKQHHEAVVSAIMNIYQTMGMKCVPFLGTVVPGIVGVFKDAGTDQRLEAYFSQLSNLVKIVRQHIRPHLPVILQAVKEYWSKNTSLQSNILMLIENIAKSLEGEFKIYLAQILPNMLDVLMADTKTEGGRAASQRVLHAFLVFGNSAEEYMHLIVPVMVRMFDPGPPAKHRDVRKAAIETIGRLSRRVNLSEFASRIIHPLSRVLTNPRDDQPMKSAAMDTLCALIFQLGRDFIHFVPLIDKILASNRIPHTNNYNMIVTKLKNGQPLPQDLSPEQKYKDDEAENANAEVQLKKLAVNQQHLKQAWEANQKATREDWHEWMRRFSVELLKESPQQPLRACQQLAGIHAPLAKALFNSAFVSCWTELYDQYQEELVRSIEVALTSPSIPPEILQSLLNLAEFMEHDDKALPIDVRTLGMYAGKCHAFAKALHYKELEFNAEQNASAVEALISINNQLQQTDAAFGILRKAQGYNDVELKETWFEKLQRWEEALMAYQKREKEEGENAGFEVIMGKMRCLHALGEWDTLSTIAQDKWSNANGDQRKHIAPLAAAAAWGMGQWELMDNYLSVMKQNSPDRSFFGAILNIHRNQFEEAYQHIMRARDGLDTELSALLGESYTRAYSVIVRVQMLAELEELITYKQNNHDPDKQERMRTTWNKRLKGCQRNVEVWQRMLKVRALVITPRENAEMYIKFASICRKAARQGLAEKSLNSLLGTTKPILSDETMALIPHAEYPVQYAVYKYLWSSGASELALNHLKSFTMRLRADFHDRSNALANGSSSFQYVNGLNGVNNISAINGMAGPFGPSNQQASLKERAELEEWRELLARCYLKLGDWQSHQHGGEWDGDQVSDVLQSYRSATQYNQEWYKAWHAWALANFEVVTNYTSTNQERGGPVPPELVEAYVIPAIQGFFKSISLSSMSSLQDTLRLLTLWFAHGGSRDVTPTVNQGIATVNVDVWLEVIPQLIARINQPVKAVREAIHNLLIEVGRNHPQALVYPLTVSMKSEAANRSRAAGSIMNAMRQHSPKLVEQAGLVSHELIRIAVLWHEQWHEGLEEASRLYFGDHNVQGMLAVLEPLHEMLRKGPETLREISFIQSFGRDLSEARDWCMAYKSSGEIGDLNQAWDLYYGVFKRIARQLPQLMSLEMQYVSPQLKDAKDLDLAAPGTAQPHKDTVCIKSFDPVATVIASKQRPRKLALVGSDGNKYTYVLKGHEDIRQDERVMQLFGLVNTLLATDPECLKRHLSIQRYAAIPLSTQSGLLGWVPNSDTLHVLIREYRESRKILLNIEHRIMLQMAPDYDNLTLMQKVEVFGYALDNTTGQDLYRVLWLKSKSSEAWLNRRTNYTRSLGVMSMVGYILGLGDRHPSNLMLDRVTGNIVHIDFGDCFEVAMHREKYPERVPFRLTRMLTFAMEVSNIEGSFRTTCEHVMRLMRDNKESLMAVLEAFIHDPLLTWRLGHRESPADPAMPADRRPSMMGVPATAADGGRRASVMGATDPNASSERPDSSYRPRLRQHSIAQQQSQNDPVEKEVQNARALQVLSRVKEKLTGRDFKKEQELAVDDQVEKLLSEATNLENLCQHYIGWCSFW